MRILEIVNSTKVLNKMLQHVIEFCRVTTPSKPGMRLRSIALWHVFYFALLGSMHNTFAQQSYLLVLGVAQDGGYPHIGCMRNCCARAWKKPADPVFVCSIALVDSFNRKWWLFEATPDIGKQLDYFNTLTSGNYPYLPEGIVLSHAHMGHYTGLMYLGREALSAPGIKVYAMPRMKKYLETNGPWSQLVELGNIELEEIQEGRSISLGSEFSFESFTVPHRDEYSETAGFKIQMGERSALFIPDINKWASWNKSLPEALSHADIAFIDGTFLSASELPYRKMEEIPHPLVEETMELLKNSSPKLQNKIHFIHFNHTNPLMWSEEARENLLKRGFSLAIQGARY